MTTVDADAARAASQPFADEAAELDAADPLGRVRAEFIGADTSLVYFDGNSLGRPLRRSAERLEAFVHEQWGGRLIRGWDESWMDLPFQIGPGGLNLSAELRLRSRPAAARLDRVVRFARGAVGHGA